MTFQHLDSNDKVQHDRLISLVLTFLQDSPFVLALGSELADNLYFFLTGEESSLGGLVFL